MRVPPSGAAPLLIGEQVDVYALSDFIIDATDVVNESNECQRGIYLALAAAVVFVKRKDLDEDAPKVG